MISLIDALADGNTDDASWRRHLLPIWGSKVVPHCLGKGLVIEPMSGLGAQGYYLATEIGADYFGFDIEPAVVAAARAKNLRRASFECLDALSFPRPKRRADVLLLGYEAINAFPWPIQTKLLDWCGAVCAQNATLIIDFLSREARLPRFDLHHESRTLNTFIPRGDRLLTLSWELPNLLPRRSTRFTPYTKDLIDKLRELGGVVVDCQEPFSNAPTTKQCLTQMKTLIVKMP
ncbi:class I SAM-dependent methyltransferase [Xanthobacter wiegelii]|uniref:class I SAM-dependent methyltransferase n=1 Tax=Xanthobacter wiegelii TaxID=3119913 RepID=UPI003729AAB9